MLKIKFSFILCIIAFFVNPYNLFSQNSNVLNIKGPTLYSLKAEENYINSFNTGIEFSLEFNKPIYKNFIFGKFDILVNAEKGSTSGLFIENYSEDSSLNVKNAFLHFNIYGIASLKGGIISQNEGWKKFLNNKTSFPGFTQKLFIKRENYLISLNLSQLQASLPSEGEIYIPSKSTFFFSESVEGNLSITPQISIKAELGLFNFSKFSNLSAHKSVFLGNTILGEGKENSKFKFNFHGYFGFLLLDINNLIRNLDTSISITNLKNEGAALERDKIFNLSLSQSLIENKNIRFETIFELFRYQSDGFPAYFMDKKYGFSNRKGIKGGIMLTLKNDLKLTIEHTRAKAILKNIFQSNFNSWFVSMELPYAL